MGKYRRNRKSKTGDPNKDTHQSDLPGFARRKRKQPKGSLYAMNAKGRLELLVTGIENPLDKIKNHDKANSAAYNPDMHPRLAYNLCWRYNYTLSKLSNTFHDTIDSVYFWYRNYPDFKDAVDTGRAAYRIDFLEEALMKKATGYEYDQVKTIEVQMPAHLPMGATVEVPAVRTEVTRKAVQPSMSALEFALTNISQGHWHPPRQDVKIDKHSRIESKSQTIDWTQAAESLGVEGLIELKGLLEKAKHGQIEP